MIGISRISSATLYESLERLQGIADFITQQFTGYRANVERVDGRVVDEDLIDVLARHRPTVQWELHPTSTGCAGSTVAERGASLFAHNKIPR
jgi:hypothetical protein